MNETGLFNARNDFNFDTGLFARSFNKFVAILGLANRTRGNRPQFRTVHFGDCVHPF